jgi:hypothetical protein
VQEQSEHDKSGLESLAISDLTGSFDFILAFAVVHEMPDAGRFFCEAANAAKTGAKLGSLPSTYQ